MYLQTSTLHLIKPYIAGATFYALRTNTNAKKKSSWHLEFYAFLSRTKFAENQLSIKNVHGILQNFLENLRVARPLMEFHKQNFAVYCFAEFYNNISSAERLYT